MSWSGRPVIKGTRISVELVMDLLTGGYTPARIIEQYDHLTVEDIHACLAYATEVIRSERVYAVKSWLEHAFPRERERPWTAKEDLRGADDRAVLSRAQAGQRVTVTCDTDFGELAFRSGLPATCGVVLLPRVEEQGHGSHSLPKV